MPWYYADVYSVTCLGKIDPGLFKSVLQLEESVSWVGVESGDEHTACHVYIAATVQPTVKRALL